VFLGGRVGLLQRAARVLVTGVPTVGVPVVGVPTVDARTGRPLLLEAVV
jgi:hypothetical protein